jgi:hypothetical protein
MSAFIRHIGYFIRLYHGIQVKSATAVILMKNGSPLNETTKDTKSKQIRLLFLPVFNKITVCKNKSLFPTLKKQKKE